MELLENIVIECKDCGSQMIVNKNEINQDLHYLIRNMSVEKQHDFEGVCKCDRCQNEMRFKIKGIEFPQKVKYHQINEIIGGVFVEEPRVDTLPRKQR